MKNKKVICSTGSKESLETFLREKYFFSPSVRIEDDGTVHNSKGIMPYKVLKKKNGRWQMFHDS